MNIEKNILDQLKERTDLFSDSLNVKVLHIPSSEEPLSYYFILLGIDLEKKQSFLRNISFMELMKDVLSNYDNTREIELTYQGKIERLDDYKPGDMYLLENVLLNPYKAGERDDTRSYFAYKHYVRNCFYDWMHEVDWKERTDIVKVNDISFTPKKSLKTLLEMNGFSKDVISRVHIVRCVRHPIGKEICYVGS